MRNMAILCCLLYYFLWEPIPPQQQCLDAVKGYSYDCSIHETSYWRLLLSLCYMQCYFLWEPIPPQQQCLDAVKGYSYDCSIHETSYWRLLLSLCYMQCLPFHIIVEVVWQYDFPGLVLIDSSYSQHLYNSSVVKQRNQCCMDIVSSLLWWAHCRSVVVSQSRWCFYCPWLPNYISVRIPAAYSPLGLLL